MNHSAAGGSGGSLSAIFNKLLQNKEQKTTENNITIQHNEPSEAPVAQVHESK